MTATQDLSGNPLVNPPQLPFGAPPLDKVKTAHFLPAFDWALDKARANIAAIKNNPAAPTFENTIEALEFATEDLSRISQIFSYISGGWADDEIRGLEEKIDLKLSTFGSDVALDEDLFARIKTVYDLRATLSLTPEQSILLENAYKSYARSGVNLPPAQKQRLREISEELSKLSTKYEQNVVLSTAAYKKFITDEKDLDGVPENAKERYATAAEKAGFKGQWLITLSPRPEEILSHCTNRALREEIARAINTIAYKDQFDNSQIVIDIARLRHEKAQILGYATYADYVLEGRMAKDVPTVEAFLQKNLQSYKKPAENYLQEVRDFALKTDGSNDLQPWDFSYYSRLRTEQKFSIDTEELKSYFDLEKVLEGLRQHAEKLFDIEMIDANSKYPVNDPDVKVYEIHDKKTGGVIALFYADYYARAGAKREGAWMSSFRSRGIEGGVNQIPIITNTCNFAKPTKTQPTLLTLREVETVFHEFGHGLHGILAEGTYSSLTGINVKWDFVELPSQLQENWVRQKEVLDSFAVHYKTGQPIPAATIATINAMQNDGAGFVGLRQTRLGLLDMAWHTTDPASITDAAAFEEKATALATIFNNAAAGGPLSTHFTHLFSGGYAAGYYSYKWAEVLEADVFSAFEKAGLYDRATGDRLRAAIYSKGGTKEPDQLFRDFMGRDPDPDALFRREGLLPQKPLKGPAPKGPSPQ